MQQDTSSRKAKTNNGTTITPGRHYVVEGISEDYGPVRIVEDRKGRRVAETEYGFFPVPPNATISECDDHSVDVSAKRRPPDTVHRTTEAASPVTPPPPPYTLLSTVKTQPVNWLWQDRIPKGELTIIDGDPGCNKSSLALDLAARVSTGREMPDGSPGLHGGVVLIQAEDSLTKTVPLRATAAGANLDRIAALEGVSIPDDLTKIKETVVAIKAKLIIIDPLMCFVDANANKEQAVRRALTPLRKLADLHDLAVVVVRHLNKSGGRNALYRGGGSIGITATVRSEFLVAPSPDDEHLRVLAHVKSNLGPKARSLLFEPVGTDGGFRIEWRGESDYTAADLLTKPKDNRPALDTAVEILLTSLKDGPTKADELQKQATSAGISLRTLERAKKELGVLAYRKGNGRHRPWFWELPETDAEGD